MLATVYSSALRGIDAELVQVEVNANEAGEAKLILLGLPDAAVKESDDRVFSALSNSGFQALRTRTTINLAPASIRKEGPFYDLPIGLGILAATHQLRAESLDRYLIVGELSLSGSTRPIRGALATAVLAKRLRKDGVLLPAASAPEAALVEGIDIFPIRSLSHAHAFLSGEASLVPVARGAAIAAFPQQRIDEADFSDVKGQGAVRRAAEVAVAGGHNLIMIGSPGSGKSMIAKRIASIMPQPDLDEFLEILRVHSSTEIGLKARLPFLGRPFRSPHHTISDVGLLGGGTIPGPGEVSLAHNGVLFLDELPEFKRSALEVLRQPLEEGWVTISRSGGKVTLPCRFTLVAAMNPCPCGYLADRRRECRCGPVQIQRYRAKISGPLLDRIDIHIEAPALTVDELRRESPGESSAAMRQRVSACRLRQQERFRGSPCRCNAQMTPTQIRKFCALDKSSGDLLQQAMEQLSLSARAYDRILKVARTIADLQESDSISHDHLLEAIQYRSLDRNVFY